MQLSPVARAFAVLASLSCSATTPGTSNDGATPDAPGASNSGGATSSGGATTTGGATASGGAMATGGVSASGGVTSTGGANQAGSPGAGGSAGRGSGNGGAPSSGGTGAITDGGTPDGATDGSPPSCAGFDDTFAAMALDPCWMILNGTAARPLMTITVSDGQLHLTGKSGVDGVWYNRSTRALVYKLLTARAFVVTTTVHPRKQSDPTKGPADAPVHRLGVGGIMARDPDASSGENYLFIMMGADESAPPHQSTEVKSTSNGNTTHYDFPAWAYPDAQLRMCRLGSDFHLFKRKPPEVPSWTLVHTYSRPDLPDTLQVGPAINFDADNDLNVGFDEITLAPTPPASMADCLTD